MITGFNTDVEHEGVVYHVQTEDKGLETPLILSLVYTGGAILASKRARYDDLIETGFDEKLLIDRLQRQHKLICAAIRAGRLDDLKKMSERDATARTAARKEQPPTEPEPQPVEPPAPAVAPPAAMPEQSPLAPKPPAVTEKPARSARKPLPAALRAATRSVRVVSQKLVADFVRTEEVAASESLSLTLIDEKNYRGGERLIMRVRVEHGGVKRQAISGAEVIIKILGSTFRPLILQTPTDADGIATFSIQLPHFRSGRAAILVRTAANGYEAELRRIIQQG